ncbi:SIR2 family protein [Arthrobacter koreensis]|uniref:SIR2 family protein n=1 Tax=Arthrobacter koreensis TaxID=199136 RepID=UPI000A69A074|nr:SIR2 family protein [Arthrobacter koreensis]
MWITRDVDLPPALFEAQAEGRLVLFVGAGASYDSPSSLPLFGDLARQLATMARVDFSDTVALDYFLGSMPGGFDTHRHARDLVDRQGSSPNTTHEALVRIASSSGSPRIVTTNFDDHLASAADLSGIQLGDKWVGPALPLGDEFSGIVHLHGSILRDPRELVLTDGDFGRAYLTNAWATRFLLPMFKAYTVVFIGYSHDDPLMRYLALGLPSGTPRFAFVSDDAASDVKWSRLGVQAIGYPARGNDHSALVAALEAWDRRVRMGRTEHRARMAEIVAAGTTLTPVDSDYLIDRLSRREGVVEFGKQVDALEASEQVSWLQWLENLPEFESAFKGQDGDSASNLLSNWFARTFVASPTLNSAALHTIQRLGQEFAPALFDAMAIAAQSLCERDVEAGRRWKAFLASSVRRQSAPISSVLLSGDVSADRPEDYNVLRAALRPYLSLKPRWFTTGAGSYQQAPDAAISWNSDEYSLKIHVDQIVEAAASGEPVLGVILEDALNSAYDLLDAYHGQRDFDPLSFGRAAIEVHPQDEFREPIDALIDGLRSYGERALLVWPELPERWWAQNRCLFRRLALHLLVSDGNRSSDEKTDWILSESALYDHELKHEVYRVLASTVPSVSEETLGKLLSAVMGGPDYPADIPDHDKHTEYAKYNLLVWLCQVAPTRPDVRAALEAVKNQNPEFEPRTHPDFDRWMTGGEWGGRLPMDPGDFTAALDKDPVRALEELMERDYSRRDFDQPEWRDALSLVSQVIEARPDLGMTIWGLLDGCSGDKDEKHGLRMSIIDGWSKGVLGDSLEAAIELASEEIGNLSSARSLSGLLLGQVRRCINSEDTRALDLMRQMARGLWVRHSSTFVTPQGASADSFAPLYLNSWPGDLTQYWISEIERRWGSHRDGWSGLVTEEREALLQLLEDSNGAEATVPAVARQLYFLFAADETFAINNVLPLFQREETAEMSWKAYLYHPRCNDKLLAAGLLKSAIDQWGRVSGLGENTLRRQFFDFVISVVSYSTISDEERQALLDGAVLADGGVHATDFAHCVTRFLVREQTDGEGVWKQWLGSHIYGRLNGVPRAAELSELRRWADSVPYLGSAVPEAAALFKNRGIGFDARSLIGTLPVEPFSSYSSVLVEYFEERIRHCSRDRLTQRVIQRLIDALSDALGEVVAKPLLEAASGVGFDGEEP